MRRLCDNHPKVTWVRGPLARRYGGRQAPTEEHISASSSLGLPLPRKRGAGEQLAHIHAANKVHEIVYPGHADCQRI
jgi:hypothetical protein